MFWPLQLNFEILGVPEDSQSPRFKSVSVILTLFQKWGYNKNLSNTMEKVH